MSVHPRRTWHVRGYLNVKDKRCAGRCQDPPFLFLDGERTEVGLRFFVPVLFRVHLRPFLSPIAHRAVRVEAALQHFLLERMLLHLGLVDLDAQAGRLSGRTSRPFFSTVKPSGTTS